MPGRPVVLDSFGGVVCVARPENLPEGASSRCNDVDFSVGQFIQRAGQQSVYSYSSAASFGPNGGGTAADVDTEGNPWTNPGNILANDGNYASVTLSTTSYPVLA